MSDEFHAATIDAMEQELETARKAFTNDALARARVAVLAAETASEEETKRAKLDLARLLINSPNDAEVREGIEALIELQALGFEGREALFLQSVANLHLGDFAEARENIRRLTMLHPFFTRGVVLREVLRRRLQTDGPRGLLIAGGVVLGALLLAGWLWSRSRPTPVAAPAPAPEPARHEFRPPAVSTLDPWARRTLGGSAGSLGYAGTGTRRTG